MWRGFIAKGHDVTCGDDGNILYLDYGSRYMSTYICLKTNASHLKLMNFTLCKVYFYLIIFLEMNDFKNSAYKNL